MARSIPSGRIKPIVWGGNPLTLSGSAFDVSGTTLFAFDGGSVQSFRAGRNPALNSLSSLAAWTGYIVAAGANISLPNETQGFGFAPEGALPSTTPMGINLDSITDYSPQNMWVDLFKRARPFYSNVDSQFDTGTIDYSPTYPGYPRTLSQNQVVETPIIIGAGNAFPTGQYTILYEGTGTIGVTQTTATLGAVTGTTTKSVPLNYNGGDLWIRITALPNASDPIRNIRVIMPGHAATYETQPFDPAFLGRLEPFSVIRFMDFLRTNSNPLVNWADRVTKTSFTQADNKGAAIEWAIDLCNALQKDAWICVPHQATDDFVTQMATLVRDNLDSNLNVYVEYSNECWNGIFGQAGYCSAQWDVIAPGNSLSGFDKYKRFYPYRSLRVWNTWKTVFNASSQGDRVKRVLGGWAALSNVGQDLLTFNDATFGITGDSTDYFAIAPYVEGTSNDSANAATTLTLTNAQIIDTMRDHLTTVQGYINNHLAYLNPDGDFPNIKLVCYEGGTHLTAGQFPNDADELGNPATGSDTTQFKMNAKFVSVNSDPGMEALIQEYLETWFTTMAGESYPLFCYFNYVSPYVVSGYWGLMQHQRQSIATAYKYRGLLNTLGLNPADYEIS